MVKRSRIGIKRRQRKVNIGIAIFFLVILPVTAVVIGSRITEWVVVPTINTDYILNSPDHTILNDIEEPEEDVIKEVTNSTVENIEKKEMNTETIDLNSLSVSMIQIASISDNKNIEVLIEELNNYGFPSIVYKIDNVYKVYTYGATQRQHVEQELDRVRAVYPDAYIGQMNIPQKQVSYLAEENRGTKEVIGGINTLIKLLDESSDLLYKFMHTEGNIEEYKKVLNNHQEVLSQITEEIENVELPLEFISAEDINKMIEYQEKNISESLKTIEEDQNIQKLQNYFLDTLFRTIEVAKK